MILNTSFIVAESDGGREDDIVIQAGALKAEAVGGFKLTLHNMPENEQEEALKGSLENWKERVSRPKNRSSSKAKDTWTDIRFEGTHGRLAQQTEVK